VPALAAALALTIPLLAQASQRKWLRARTAHFTLYSASDRDSVLRLAQGLEQMADLVSMWGLGLKSTMRPRVVLVAMPDKASFEPHLPRAGGRKVNTAGYVTHTAYGHWIGYAEYDFRGRLVAQHEYTHTLVSDEFQRIPLCLNEGLAEYLNTFSAGHWGAQIGLDFPWYREVLRHQPMLRMNELFRFDNESAAKLGDSDRHLLYAESWGLVHYLMSAPEGSRRLLPFARAIAGGASPQDAFATTS
jgi:hypothetical protein